MNELLFLAGVFVYLSSVVILYKIFGKNGLYVYSVFSSIITAVAACKCFRIFGSLATAGIVFYACSYLVTDILSEKYGKKESEKAVWYGLAGTILWVIGTQLVLLFVPAFSNDKLGEALKILFGVTPRVFAASMVAYICSQKFDVFMYHFIWGKTGNSKRMLWLRNNGSTMISQAIDCVIFGFLAFYGIRPTGVLIRIVCTNYIFKAIIALFDTPFMYLARKIKPLTEKKKVTVSDFNDFAQKAESA